MKDLKFAKFVDLFLTDSWQKLRTIGCPIYFDPEYCDKNEVSKMGDASQQKF